MITFLRSAHFGRIRAFANRAARQGRDENQTHDFLHVKPQRGRRESLARQFNSTRFLVCANAAGRPSAALGLDRLTSSKIAAMTVAYGVRYGDSGPSMTQSAIRS